MSLTDRSLRDLLDAFRSPAPTPGGGSASALAAAVGVALIRMVAGLPRTRTGADEERMALARVEATLAPVQQQLTAAIDEDSAAYDEVVAAYKRPKGTDEERTSRTDAIQSALIRATDVPLRVMRLATAALEAADVVEACGNPGASSDVGVAKALLLAGRRGARLNAELNLGHISNQAYVSGVRQELESLNSEV